MPILNCSHLARLLLLFAVIVSPAAAQQSQEAYIRGLYREYYQRTPNRVEVQEWLGWFQRGVSAEEIHASFIGSEELFNKYGRDVRRWIDAVFLAVNNRSASLNELNYWSQRLTALGGDRRRLGMEFLKTYGSNTTPSPGGGGGRPPNQSDLPEQILSSAESLSQSVDREFYGLQQRLLKIQANNLVSIASASRNAFRNADRNPAEAQNAIRSLQVAVDALNQSLADANGARDSRYYAAQVDQYVRRLASRLPASDNSIGWPVYPNRPGNSNIPAAKFTRLTQQLEALNGETNQFNYLISSLAMYDYRLRQLASDAEGFANQVDQARRSFNRNTTLEDVRANVVQLRRTARSINRSLNQLPTDIRVTQAWHEIAVTMDALVVEAGVDGGVFGGGQNNNIGSAQRTRILRAIDGAITACDSLDQALFPYRLYGRGIAAFLADLRDLRSRLATERQHVLANEDLKTVQFDVQNLTAVINRLNANWPSVQAVTGNNYQTLYRNLSNAMDQVYQAIR